MWIKYNTSISIKHTWSKASVTILKDAKYLLQITIITNPQIHIFYINLHKQFGNNFQFTKIINNNFFLKTQGRSKPQVTK